MGKWTKEQVLRRIQNGEDPQALGRHGGRTRAANWKQAHRYGVIARSHSDQEIAQLPWNKD